MSNHFDKTTEHVFGPVPSRRLGLSLGVDLIPRKFCTLDCVYCQVGLTTNKTIERKAFVPVDTVVEEIREKLKHVPRPDYITLAGSGEPTLHSGLGEIIDGIKGVTCVPVDVLTNGTLLYDANVRAACRKADLVLPSLDAGDEEVFQRINRPASALTLELVVSGMEKFRHEYDGQIWLEVFFIKGINDMPAQVKKMRALVERIQPDRVQLNTAVRPTAESDVEALSEKELEKLCSLMGPCAEIIADFKRVHEQPVFAAKAEEVLAMIQRRPVTMDDISAGLGIHANEASKYVEELLRKKQIISERRGDREYFRAVSDDA